jgi:hypothetical protein
MTASAAATPAGNRRVRSRGLTIVIVSVRRCDKVDHHRLAATPTVPGTKPCGERVVTRLGDGYRPDYRRRFLAWLQDSFAQAEARDDAAIMVVGQADPGFDLSDGTRAPLREPKSLVEVLDAKTLQPSTTDGFKDFLKAFRAVASEFRKPVVYVHGDSHYFRVDKPLQDSKGQRVENFTRVETFGDNQANGTNDAQWAKVYVDPDSREVFAFQPQVVPGNRVTLAP